MFWANLKSDVRNSEKWSPKLCRAVPENASFSDFRVRNEYGSDFFIGRSD